MELGIQSNAIIQSDTQINIMELWKQSGTKNKLILARNLLTHEGKCKIIYFAWLGN